MYSASDPMILHLLHEWHEAGRAEFEAHYPASDYDGPFEAKSAHQRRKWLLLDEGTSGAFAVDRETGDIYRIKAYGRANPKKRVGNIQTMTGIDLARARWV